jgi:hypothetical protein
VVRGRLVQCFNTSRIRVSLIASCVCWWVPDGKQMVFSRPACFGRERFCLTLLLLMMMAAGSILEFVVRVQRSTGRIFGVIRCGITEIYYIFSTVLHVMKYVSISSLQAASFLTISETGEERKKDIRSQDEKIDYVHSSPAYSLRTKHRHFTNLQRPDQASLGLRTWLIISVSAQNGSICTATTVSTVQKQKTRFSSQFSQTCPFEPRYRYAKQCFPLRSKTKNAVLSSWSKAQSTCRFRSTPHVYIQFERLRLGKEKAVVAVPERRKVNSRFRVDESLYVKVASWFCVKSPGPVRVLSPSPPAQIALRQVSHAYSNESFCLMK